MKLFDFIKKSVIIAPALLLACSVHEEPAMEPQITDAANQGGQLPIEVVKAASDRYEGSMIADSDSGGPGETGNGFTIVLGPVNIERLGESAARDAGQSIREIISGRLTSTGSITLLDAPEERFIDDSPRPDLARKGIKYVIKGIASHNPDAGEVTVFLRTVDTKSGKVVMVASARNPSMDKAAGDATKRLTKKLMDKMQ